MEPQPTIKTETKVQEQPNTIVKVIVLIALIALLIIGILLPIKLVPNAVTSVKNTFSSLFGSDKVTLSVDKTELKSGEAFNLSWTGNHKDNGSYILSYQCKEGVHFETSINQPYEKIGCDTQYYFSPKSNTIEITAVSELNRFIDVPVTLSFLENGSSDVKNLGDITLTITNSNVTDSRSAFVGSTTPSNEPSAPATTTVVTPAPEPTPTPAPEPKPTPKPTTTTVTRAHRVSNPYGTADLSLQFTDIGYLDRVTGQFYSSPIVAQNGIPAVRFVVTNKGDKNTGAWDFTATFPSQNHPTYTARNLLNIGPGDAIQYTLGFDYINNTRDNLLMINLDPTNAIRELSETNNVGSVHIANVGSTQ